MEDDEQRMATVEDEEQRPTTVEDDEQRSATAPGRAELQISKQNFRLASFNRRALLQIGELQSAGSASDRNRLLRDRKREREK